MNRRRLQFLSSQSRRWIPYAVLMGALIVTFLVAFYVHHTAQAKDRARFEDSVKQINTVLDSSLDTYVALVRAGTGLFAASESVEPDEFHQFVNRLELQRHYQGVQGMGFSVRVRPEERSQLIDLMHKEGNTSFKIWPEGNRAEYHSIVYLEPLDRRNQAAIGYDMFTEPTRRAAMEQARDTGVPTASGRVTLVQEIDAEKQAGFLIYAPVYRNGAPTNTLEQRRAALFGFVYAPFRTGDLLTNVLEAREYPGIDFQVFDGSKAEPDNLLYNSARAANSVSEASRFTATSTLPVAQRSWTLNFRTNREFEAGSGTNLAMPTLLSGIMLSLLLFAITRSQTRARTMAVSATRELRHSERSLRQSLGEREVAEVALRKSKDELLLANYRFQVAEEASNSFSYDWNLETDTVVRSENFSRVLGYEPDEIAPTWEAWKSITNPSDFPLSKEEAIASLNVMKGDTLEAEYRVLHKDGSYRNLYNRGLILRDENGRALRVIGRTVDVTEFKVAEEKVRAANERAIVEYERLLDRIAVLAQKLGAARELTAIYRALRDFALSSVPCNGLFVSLYDEEKDVRTAAYGWGDGIEIDVSELPPMPVTKDGPNSRAVRTGEVVLTNDFMKTTSGHPQVIVGPENNLRPQTSLAVPMLVLGKVVGTIEVQSYESAAYKPEHQTAMRMAANLTAVAIENAQLLTRESHARAEAEESNRLKDEFLATVSHELRTPLTAILGWADLLETGHLATEKAERAIQTIQRNAKAQAEIIEDILDVSRIVTGNLYLDLQPTDLNRVIDTAINVVRPTAEAKHIQIQTELADQPVLVSGDAHRLQQVVWNLLSNAVKFTPSGGKVGILVFQDGSQVHFQITDNGAGIRADFLPHVFERFRQADSSTTRDHGGLGLGLAIVRHLVEIHGGSVRAHSEGEGKGATFTVTLPVLAAGESAAARMQRTGGELNQPQPELNGVHVLVVDDDAGAREMISAALNERNARVTAVASAREALNEICRSHPDILVSDIAMPGQDGYELIRQMRTLEHAKLIPAVAITAYARDEDRRRALAAGYQSYLPKPIEPAELIKVVAELASESRPLGIAGG